LGGRFETQKYALRSRLQGDEVLARRHLTALYTASPKCLVAVNWNEIAMASPELKYSRSFDQHDRPSS